MKPPFMGVSNAPKKRRSWLIKMEAERNLLLRNLLILHLNWNDFLGQTIFEDQKT